MENLNTKTPPQIGVNVTSAMVLAAGLGTRMRHLSNIRPKPLTPVAGRCLLDRLIDRLIESGITNIVINTHYMAEMIESQMAKRNDCDIKFSPESTLLDTAGGTAKALPLLGNAPFYAINSDALWVDSTTPILKEMADNFNVQTTDHMLLMQDKAKLSPCNYVGKGDYHLNKKNQLTRRTKGEEAEYIYAGIQLLNPAALENIPQNTPLSFNPLWDIAQKSSRLHGLAFKGQWHHVGNPEALAKADAAFAQRV